jgi:hypothetical protein
MTQIIPKERGTLIAAAISKSGIVLGSDSRSVLYDNNKAIAAYYEDSRKIFPLGDKLLAMAGQVGFNNRSFRGIVLDFKRLKKENVGVLELYDAILNYSSTVLSAEEFEALNRNQFIICGYINTKPFAIFYHDGKREIIHEGYITNVIKTNNNAQFTAAVKQLDLQGCQVLIEKFIKNSIDGSNEKAVADIGGPIHLATVNTKEIKWISKRALYEYSTIEEFAKAHEEGKVKMWYRSEKDAQMLTLALQKYLK